MIVKDWVEKIQVVSPTSEHNFKYMVCVQAMAQLNVISPIEESPVDSEMVVELSLARTGYPMSAPLEY